MLVALAFCRKDANLARRMFDWWAELSPNQTRHELLLIASSGMGVDEYQPVYQAAHKAFSKVTMAIHSGSAPDHWPEAPNELFKTAVDHISTTNAQPFFWMEPDCVPLTADCLDRIQGEYYTHGAAFMGVIVTPGEHLQGTSVYPANPRRYNNGMFSRNDIPWDCNNPRDTLKHTHPTLLIQHRWSDDGRTDVGALAPTFPDAGSLSKVDQSAVIFHRCKDGSLIDRLREKRSGGKVETAERPIAIVLLGRYGDIIHTLPVCKDIERRTGRKPSMVVAQEFAGVFARTTAANTIIWTQWAGEANMAANMAESMGYTPIIAQLRGNTPYDNVRAEENFLAHQYALLGYRGMVSKLSWDGVWDRRDLAAEKAIKDQLAKKTRYVVVNYAGVSSEAPDVGLLKQVVEPALPRNTEVVDITGVKAPNFVDLLGLLEGALLLVTVDSAPLHLNRCTRTPCVMFGRGDGWLNSGDVENVVARASYTELDNKRVVKDTRAAIYKAITRAS